MSHKNKKSLVRQVQEAYDSMLSIGRSKHQDKINGCTADKIYSWGTYKDYVKHGNYFARFCKEKYGCKTLEECRPYVDEWLRCRIDNKLSAYTIKLDAASIAKLYQCSTTDFIKFCKSTGLRRAEMKVLTGDKLICKDGQYYIIVNRGSKGGKYREAEIVGNVDHVKKMMHKAGTGRVFEKVPEGADIHGYRSDYATAVYNKYARPIEDIPYDRINRGLGCAYQSQVYHCRGDKKGVKLDKLAMEIASKNLGHNRISVIAEHYLR